MHVIGPPVAVAHRIVVQDTFQFARANQLVLVNLKPFYEFPVLAIADFPTRRLHFGKPLNLGKEHKIEKRYQNHVQIQASQKYLFLLDLFSLQFVDQDRQLLSTMWFSHTLKGLENR